MKATASTREARSTAPGQRRLRKTDAGAVWAKYNLTASPLSPRSGAPRFTFLPRASRFKMALEELGGIFSLFGRFLMGRADLLPSSHLRQLRKTRSLRLEIATSDLLERELNGRVRDPVPLRAAPCSELYRATYQDRLVVVEIFETTAEAIKEESWADFLAGIKRLTDYVEAPVSKDSVLNEFRQWLVLQADIERKRGILRNLQNLPAGCISLFPRSINELESKATLVYEWMDGQTLDSEMRRAGAEAQKKLQTVIEGLLEQALFLSVIPTEVEADNLLCMNSGNVGFRTVPAMVSVPPEWNYELLQYTASSIAGDTSRAVHMLSRMVRGELIVNAEQRLWQELSALQPELKVDSVTPDSVSTLENYWRALAASNLSCPLFLQLFHRQMTILGQYNGEVAPTEDLVSESVWPALGRVLRFRFAELVSSERAREWLVGTGLLFFETARQFGLLLEQLREDDFLMAVEAGELYPRERRLNRRTVALVASAVISVVFLLTLQIALRSSGSMVQLSASLVAAVSAVILFIFIARID